MNDEAYNLWQSATVSGKSLSLCKYHLTEQMDSNATTAFCKIGKMNVDVKKHTKTLAQSFICIMVKNSDSVAIVRPAQIEINNH